MNGNKENLGTENKCPLCFSKKVKVIRAISSMEASEFINKRQSGEFLHQMSRYIEDVIWRQETSYFMNCLNCSLEYSFPFKAADKNIYNIIYDESSIDDDFWNWDFQEAYEIIKKKIINVGNKDFKILELGSGSGHFIKKISKNLIPPTSCYITEYSDNCRNAISNLGIHSYGDIQELDKAIFNSSFDFICMFQLLEHIDNLYDLINDLGCLAKKDALIIITVPNSYQRIFYDRNYIFEDIPPIHISRFNVLSFNKIAEIMNWVMKYYKVEQSSKKEKLKRFLYLEYMRFPFFNFFEKKFFKSLKTLRKPFLFVIFLIIAVVKVKSIFELIFCKNLGTSQFVVFQKD